MAGSIRGTPYLVRGPTGEDRIRVHYEGGPHNGKALCKSEDFHLGGSAFLLVHSEKGFSLSTVYRNRAVAEAEHKKWALAEYEVREVKVEFVPRELDALGRFSVSGKRSDPALYQTWTHVVLTRQVLDIPAGTPVDRVEYNLCTGEVIYYSRGNMILGTEFIHR